MVVTFLMMLTVALLAVVFRVEFEAWMPWMAERLRRAALKPLKGPLRERYDEEWAAYLAEIPGQVGKVVAALGFNWASRRISVRSAAYRIAYRSTLSLAGILKDFGKLVMAVANQCDRTSSVAPVRYLSWQLSRFAFEIIFSAMHVMHARTRFIEDHQARAQAEASQLQRFEALLSKLQALSDKADPEPLVTSED